jgi:hypothetical protein
MTANTELVNINFLQFTRIFLGLQQVLCHFCASSGKDRVTPRSIGRTSRRVTRRLRRRSGLRPTRRKKSQQNGTGPPTGTPPATGNVLSTDWYGVIGPRSATISPEPAHSDRSPQSPPARPPPTRRAGSSCRPRPPAARATPAAGDSGRRCGPGRRGRHRSTRSLGRVQLEEPVHRVGVEVAVHEHLSRGRYEFAPERGVVRDVLV